MDGPTHGIFASFEGDVVAKLAEADQSITKCANAFVANGEAQYHHNRSVIDGNLPFTNILVKENSIFLRIFGWRCYQLAMSLVQGA